jgi:hypothetical protein
MQEDYPVATPLFYKKSKLNRFKLNTRTMDKHSKFPNTVDEAVDLLIEELSFGDRTIIANMQEEDLANLDVAFGMRIRVEFGLGNGNKNLLQSCCFESGQLLTEADLASAFIIKSLWKRVQDTPVLKVVK